MKLLELKKLIREQVRKVLKENTLTPGQRISDRDLIDGGYIKPAHVDEWLELFSDEYDFNPARQTKIANAWLAKNGYAFRVATAVDQDDEGEITWKIK